MSPALTTTLVIGGVEQVIFVALPSIGAASESAELAVTTLLVPPALL
jgi:hypothetical protein